MIQLQLQLQYITIFIPISSCSEAFSTHFLQCGAQSTSSLIGGRWGVWVDSNPCRTDDQSCVLTTRLRKLPLYQSWHTVTYRFLFIQINIILETKGISGYLLKQSAKRRRTREEILGAQINQQELQ